MGYLKVPAFIYGALCGILWFLPLFRLLHVESSAVIAFASFFVAGLSALHLFKQDSSVLGAIKKHLALLLIPLGMLTVSLLWQPNCGYAQGFLFFLLFPGVTVVFAVSLAFALHRSRLKRKTIVLIGAGMGISLAGPVFDIGFHSQFFTYNHVFGGVMGPIYDEEVPIRSGLVVFRGLSLLWALFFVLWGVRKEERFQRNTQYLWVRGMVILAIGCIYFFSARLQINTPTWYIQSELGGHLATEHFDIYYDPEETSSSLLYQYEHEHEYRYAYYKEKMGVDVPDRIQSFIYPNPETKEQFTGARFTNVAPVWLRIPQIHLYADVFDQVFPHELVHVFSREFGLPVINASLSVGLVEGFAVALEPSEGRPTPHEQVLTAALIRNGFTDLSVGEQVEGSLSPFGFWTGRGAVSYTTMGSFVRFLIDRYGMERVKEVYAYSNFSQVYGKSPQALTKEWEAFLKTLPAVSRVTHDYVTRRFSVPSLFEQRCPHHVPRVVVKHRESLRALTEADTAQALDALEQAFISEPRYQPALETWSQVHLALGMPDSVITRIQSLFSEENLAFRTPLMWMLMGDAYTLTNKKYEALEAYEQAQTGLPLYLHDQVGFLELRKAIVEHPELLSILVSGTVYEEKLDKLKNVTVGKEVALFMEAILHSHTDRIEEARNILEHLDINKIPTARINREALDRYFRMKKTQLYFQSKLTSQALREATQLEEELRSIGALPEAAFYADFAAKMRYINRAL